MPLWAGGGGHEGRATPTAPHEHRGASEQCEQLAENTGSGKLELPRPPPKPGELPQLQHQRQAAQRQAGQLQLLQLRAPCPARAAAACSGRTRSTAGTAGSDCGIDRPQSGRTYSGSCRGTRPCTHTRSPSSAPSATGVGAGNLSSPRKPIVLFFCRVTEKTSKLDPRATVQLFSGCAALVASAKAGTHAGSHVSRYPIGASGVPGALHHRPLDAPHRSRISPCSGVLAATLSRHIRVGEEGPPLLPAGCAAAGDQLPPRLARHGPGRG